MYPGVDFLSMRMTMDVYLSYLERMPVARSQRMMDMAQATIYAQLTTEGRRSLWNGWSNTITRINNTMIQRDGLSQGKSLFTWNGMPLSLQALKGRFVAMWGKGAAQ